MKVFVGIEMRVGAIGVSPLIMKEAFATATLKTYSKSLTNQRATVPINKPKPNT